MTEGDLILKTDTRDRVRTPRAQREALLDEFERSGLSGMRFAERVGVKYQTFTSWVRKRRLQGGGAGGAGRSSGGIRWLEATIEDGIGSSASPGEARLRIELPGGASLEVSSRGQAVLAAELLSVLEKRTC